MANTRALSRYFDEVCDANNLSSFGGANGVLKYTLEALRPLSTLRYVNQRFDLRYRLDSLGLTIFYDGLSTDLDALIESASTGKFGNAIHKAKLKKYAKKHAAEDYDLLQFTSGHDVCAAIGISLRSHLGQRRPAQTLRSAIEMHLRLSVHRTDLDETGFSLRIIIWETENRPYRILASLV